jgi:hypothetical protein
MRPCRVLRSHLSVSVSPRDTGPQISGALRRPNHSEVDVGINPTFFSGRGAILIKRNPRHTRVASGIEQDASGLRLIVLPARGEKRVVTLSLDEIHVSILPATSPCEASPVRKGNVRRPRSKTRRVIRPIPRREIWIDRHGLLPQAGPGFLPE